MRLVKFGRVAALSPPFFVAATALQAQALTDWLGPTPQGLLGLAVLTFLAFGVFLGVRINSRGGLSAAALLGLGLHLAGTALILATVVTDTEMTPATLPLLMIGTGVAILVLALLASFLF